MHVLSLRSIRSPVEAGLQQFSWWTQHLLRPALIVARSCHPPYVQASVRTPHTPNRLQQLIDKVRASIRSLPHQATTVHAALIDRLFLEHNTCLIILLA
jgi:hypothetical protein